MPLAYGFFELVYIQSKVEMLNGIRCLIGQEWCEIDVCKIDVTC